MFPSCVSMGPVSREYFITLIFEADVNGRVTYWNNLYYGLPDSLNHKSEKKQRDYRDTQLKPDPSARL
jgi:hypothetical protein